MTKTSTLLTTGLIALAGCGNGGDDATAAMAPEKAASAEAAATGTTIVLGSSQFGRILFNAKRQAIYVFQRDRRRRSNCYGECARLWPPVYTRGKPRARNGVRQSLLGTIRRRNGRLQVTYAGRPLYYYAHEGPGEVKCHNVNLNGGLWWVVGANGRHL